MTLRAFRVAHTVLACALCAVLLYAILNCTPGFTKACFLVQLVHLSYLLYTLGEQLGEGRRQKKQEDD